MKTSNGSIQVSGSTAGDLASDRSVENPFSGDLANQQDYLLETLLDAAIMMVDDEPLTMEIVQAYLKDAGYRRFITTTESVRAMDIIAKECPDILLLDLMMPDVDGFDILTRLRANDNFKHLPVIILTSSNDSDTKLKALELGANDFLAKPVDPSELALRLRNTLAAKAYQDRLAFYDPLTGLYNRRTFMDHLDWAVRSAKRTGTKCAILQIDLDRFKHVNDALGPSTGDALLVAVATRLEKYIRSSDSLGRIGRDFSQSCLCRVGGDEFSVMLPAITNIEDVAQVAQRVLSIMKDAFHPEGHEIFITPSIGIAVFPDAGKEINTLLKHAEMAMSHAKERGGNTYKFYSKQITGMSAEQLMLTNKLRKAIERDELKLYYQPKLNIRTGQVIGAEALMRWNHPDFGIVSPTIFIPIAEEIGLISLFDEWAVYTACNQNKAWQLEGLRPIPVSINLTSQSFRHGRIVSSLKKVLEISRLDKQYVKLELTESMIMENAEKNIEAMHQLKEMEVKLSIDDFGTGYSSLSYLTQLPLDELKIDRSFIKDIPRDTNKVAIVKAIIAMAHNLGLTVVAEGVETEQQLAFLKSVNCNEYQGFLFSKPIPTKEFAALIGSEIPKVQPVLVEET